MIPVLDRNNVRLSGPENAPAMVFSHGFGCDQAMWSGVAPAFEGDYRVVLHDHTGAGGSDLRAWDPERYASLEGYARDLVEIGEELSLSGATFVGHSVAAMIGVLAHRMAPQMFGRLILIGPSPRYVDDVDYRVVLHDHTGAGGSDLRAWDPERYASLEGYARDLVEIGEELSLSGATFVGHSVAAMIGVLAHRMAPQMFGRLILIGPSPRYVDDVDYRGGFSRSDIDELLESMAGNYLGWSRTMGRAIAGNPDRPEVGESLASSFCRTDPDIAEHFARVTFLSDNREDLAAVSVDTLIVQSGDDFVAPRDVGEYLQRVIPGSRLVVLDTHGHCPHLSDPELVVEAMRSFLA